VGARGCGKIIAVEAGYLATHMSLAGTVVFGEWHGSKLSPVSRGAGPPPTGDIVHRYQGKGGYWWLGNRLSPSTQGEGTGMEMEMEMKIEMCYWCPMLGLTTLDILQPRNPVTP